MPAGLVTSAIPGMINALMLLLLADSALSTVDVVDGPLLDWELMTPALPQRGDGKAWIVIGSQPGDAMAATGTQEWGGTGTGQNAHSRDEVFAVLGTVVTFDGGSDVRPVRDRGFAILGRLEAILRADPSISDSVLYSRFGGVDRLDQAATTSGLAVDILFNVQCRAYLTS